MVDMGSIIESIREARDVKAKFVGDGEIGKLKYNITYDGSSDSYDIYYSGSYKSTLHIQFKMVDDRFRFGVDGDGECVAEYSLGGKSSSLRISQDTRIDVSKCRDKNILAELWIFILYWYSLHKRDTLNKYLFFCVYYSLYIIRDDLDVLYFNYMVVFNIW